MPTATECVCCGEIPQTLNKRSDGVEVGCITLHPGFPSVCLNPWVLQTAYYSYCQHYGAHAHQTSKQVLRQHCSLSYILITTGNIDMLHISNWLAGAGSGWGGMYELSYHHVQSQKLEPNFRHQVVNILDLVTQIFEFQLWINLQMKIVFVSVELLLFCLAFQTGCIETLVQGFLVQNYWLFPVASSDLPATDSHSLLTI